MTNRSTTSARDAAEGQAVSRWHTPLVALLWLIAGCSAPSARPAALESADDDARRAAACSESSEPLAHPLAGEAEAAPQRPTGAKEERAGSSTTGLDVCSDLSTAGSTPEEMAAAARACRTAWDDWVGQTDPRGSFRLDRGSFQNMRDDSFAHDLYDRSTAPEADDRPEPTYWGQTVSRIEVAGLQTLPEEFVRPQILTAVGQPLEAAALRADLRRLWGLEALEDVQVSAMRSEDGVSLTFTFAERPLIGAVFLSGDARELGETPQLERMAGGVFQPAGLHRELERLRLRYENRGHLRFQGEVRLRRLPNRSVDVCFIIEPGERFVIDRFEFDGNDQVSDAMLREQIDTLDDRVNVMGGVYRADLLEANIESLQALFYEHGCIDAVVGRPRAEMNETGGTVAVTVPVYEGGAYSYGELTVEGDLVAPVEEYLGRLGIETGQLFVRSQVMAAMTAIEELHRERTGAPPAVAPLSEVEHEQLTVSIRFVVGGP